MSIVQFQYARRAIMVAGVLSAFVLVSLLASFFMLQLSLPRLEGGVAAEGLAALVTVERDAQGVPTVTGRTRADLAWALGYLHAQERFFQMDLLRRTAAGELSDLVGSAALQKDRVNRVHRFRNRASTVLAAMRPEERLILDDYVAGVNRGLGDLGSAPFEYLLLLARPAPWKAEDTILVVYAMYLTLQEANGVGERRRADAIETLGQPLADFLFPAGTSWDAALDGSMLPVPKIPLTGLKHAASQSRARNAAIDPPIPGSNGFAVGAEISARGAAIVANDMHLGLREPNTWYRARLVMTDSADARMLDVTGVTLPGAPNIVAGSNGRIAWGFTNSYVDASDVVVLEKVDGASNRYRTPEGPRELSRIEERLCQTCSRSETLTVEESIWGPVIGLDAHGRKLAYRWIAHDPVAVNLRGALDLEAAASVRDALEIAHRVGIPHQNVVVGDTQGDIGWTVTGPLPRRFGFDGREPTSWAEGVRGWNGFLSSQETPTIYNPPNHRIWTANARIVGGEALTKLGDGSYAHGARASQIRDSLLARSRFDERDLLAIQLDDRGLLLERWQNLLLDALRSRAGQPRYARLIPEVEHWGRRAQPESVGYRLVRAFRLELISAIYDAYTRVMPVLEEAPNKPQLRRLPTNQADEPAWRLLSERPAQLIPPGYSNWDAVVDRALEKVLSALETEAGGRLDRFTWGSANHTGIYHPLAQALFGMSTVLAPPDDPLPGDVYQPRVSAPGFGASVRFVVTPGQEATGVFHMPTGQSGHPLSPYYNVGHEDWAKGQPTPFLPGATFWRLRFQPAEGRSSLERKS
jgi:penicillin amidase